MILYLVFTGLYQFMTAILYPKSKQSTASIIMKFLFFILYLVNFAPMIYYYIQHKDKVPGGWFPPSFLLFPAKQNGITKTSKPTLAYTMYAFFEWAIVVFDVGFDATSIIDFSNFSIQLVDTTGCEKPEDSQKDHKEVILSPFRAFLKYVVDIYLGIFLSMAFI